MDFLADSTIATVATLILTLVVSVIGVKYVKAEQKLSDAQNFLNTLIDATKDRTVDSEEVKKIKSSFSKLLGKKDPEVPVE